MYSFMLGFFHLMQGLATLFYKGPDSNYLWLCIPFGLSLNYSTSAVVAPEQSLTSEDLGEGL